MNNWFYASNHVTLKYCNFILVFVLFPFILFWTYFLTLAIILHNLMKFDKIILDANLILEKALTSLNKISNFT